MSALPVGDGQRHDERRFDGESYLADVPAAPRTHRAWSARRSSGRRDLAPAMPQTIIIWGERPTLPEQKPPLASRRFVFLAKTVTFLAVMAAIYWGPPYVTCRHMKERGMFYYGTTISSCVQERIDSRSNPFEAISKYVLPAI